jgi:ubiquinone/menaquinone biosynthesis C-methylase UbiE
MYYTLRSIHSDKILHEQMKELGLFANTLAKPPQRVLRWFRDLRCPHCFESYKPLSGGERGGFYEFDVLFCRCGASPVVAGIPILGKGVSVSANQIEEAVNLIKGGHYQEALWSLLAPPSPSLAPDWLLSFPSVKGIRRIKHIAHLLALQKWGAQLVRCDSACEFLDAYLRGSGLKWGGDAYDYFTFRFGMPRHLVALAFCSLIDQPTDPILEIACGCGHVTRGLIDRSNGQPVVGVDRSFFALFVAKNWIAPEADYICCAAYARLPFANHVFSTVSCTDGFHYLADKATSIREATRVMREDGVIILSVVRNARVRYRSAGQPLQPEGYQALFSDLPHRLVADSAVLRRYIDKQGPALERQASLEQINEEPLLSLVASQRSEIFKDHGLFNDWPHIQGFLRLNPLYSVEQDSKDGMVDLRLQFPSTWYEEDNDMCKLYLPETVQVSSQAFHDLAHERRTPQLESLISCSVVLGMPQNYASVTISSAWAKLAEYNRLPETG